MLFTLASQSPRRKEILTNLNIDFNVVVSDIDESLIRKNTPSELVIALANAKAYAVSEKLLEPSIIIGVDTVVVLGNTVIEKPTDDNDAFNILRSLSGQEHMVYSGISLIDKYSDKVYTSYDITNVFMRELTTDDITNYIATKEPFDKAGAYGIQGIGSILIDKIVGDYFNVMGFPVKKFYQGLQSLGYDYFKLIKK
ncbi:MAG: maf protein [Clostridiales bacterium]|jgi:septum formation protein|nr:maf protein [Clostridiales bacterium]